MESREKLFGFVEAGASEEDLPSFAAALDDYAHALAEQIRSRKHATHDYAACLVCFVYDESARVIDPKGA